MKLTVVSMRSYVRNTYPHNATNRILLFGHWSFIALATGAQRWQGGRRGSNPADWINTKWLRRTYTWWYWHCIHIGNDRICTGTPLKWLRPHQRKELLGYVLSAQLLVLRLLVRISWGLSLPPHRTQIHSGPKRGVALYNSDTAPLSSVEALGRYYIHQYAKLPY